VKRLERFFGVPGLDGLEATARCDKPSKKANRRYPLKDGCINAIAGRTTGTQSFRFRGLISIHFLMQWEDGISTRKNICGYGIMACQGCLWWRRYEPMLQLCCRVTRLHAYTQRYIICTPNRKAASSFWSSLPRCCRKVCRALPEPLKTISFLTYISSPLVYRTSRIFLASSWSFLTYIIAVGASNKPDFSGKFLVSKSIKESHPSTPRGVERKKSTGGLDTNLVSAEGAHPTMSSDHKPINRSLGGNVPYTVRRRRRSRERSVSCIGQFSAIGQHTGHRTMHQMCTKFSKEFRISYRFHAHKIVVTHHAY
jgi:hypothetical protein